MNKTAVIFFFVLMGMGFSSMAQVKEINPSIQWRFIKSQELNLLDGSWYSYEFPAEKGFDYIFTMTHNTESAKASIQVFDLQDNKIAEFKSEDNKITAALEFDVTKSGTYKVYFGVNVLGTPDKTEVPVLFTLIRREKV